MANLPTGFLVISISTVPSPLPSPVMDFGEIINQH